MRWAEVALVTSLESADAVVDILVSKGCGGVASSESDSGSQRLCAYFPVDDRLPATLEDIKSRLESLSDLGLSGASSELNIAFVEDADWATAWKSFFKPLVIGRIVIKPTWEDFDARPEHIVVELDPGMAFGTGNHATTQMCVLALQRHLSDRSHPSHSSHLSHPLSVLDVGCGSGILAITAAKLGAARAVGVDIDPIAVKAARENVLANGVESSVEIFEGDSPAAGGLIADLVVANIVAGTIIEMRELLFAAVKPGGILICSGIIEEREAEVATALAEVGLRAVETLREGEWVTLITRKP